MCNDLSGNLNVMMYKKQSQQVTRTLTDKEKLLHRIPSLHD